MGNMESLFSLVQPQSNDPEVIQFFEMLTLPTTVLGYSKGHVIDALRSLEGLYRNKITELNTENQRNQKFRLSQIKQKDCTISSLKERVEKERIVSLNNAGAQIADSRGQIDVFSQVIPEIQQSLNFVIRKATAEAQQICRDARQKADGILEETRRTIENERRRHLQALNRISELKKQYMADLSAMQTILKSMQAEAASFQECLKNIKENPMLEQSGDETARAAEPQ